MSTDLEKPPRPTKVPPPKPKNLKFLRAAFSYTAQAPDELSFNKGDLLFIVDDKTDPDWWKARCRGKEGLVPANFVDKSSDVNFSLIHDACRRGNLELLEECIQNKVPVNSLDLAGNTPLHCAAHSGNDDIVKRLLLVPQIKLDIKNRLGDTPLHQAAWKGHSGIVQILLDSGCDVNAKNDDGKSPRDLAEEPETKSVIRKWMGKSFERNTVGDYNDEDYLVSDDEVEEAREK